MKVYDIDEKTIKAIKNATIFFLERFPERNLDFEIECGYFLEWVERFKNDPERYMDSESLELWRSRNLIERNKQCGTTSTIVKVK